MSQFALTARGGLGHCGGGPPRLISRPALVLVLSLMVAVAGARGAQCQPPSAGQGNPPIAGPPAQARGTRVGVPNGTPNGIPNGARIGGAVAGNGGGSAAWGGPGQRGLGGPGAGMRRQALVQQLQERFEQIVRQRLRLTDDQVGRLRQTNQRFSVQRRALNERERAIRGAMREELQPGVAANQERLASLVDSLIALQRERLDIVQAEQRDEAAYLTPLQRVQYYGLQEQLRRRLEEIRRRRPPLPQAQPLSGVRSPDGSPSGASAAPADTLGP